MPPALDLNHIDAVLARRLSLVAGYRGPWVPSVLLGVKARAPKPAPVPSVRTYRPSPADLSGEKTCSRCGVLRPIDHFYRIRAGNDARQARCKGCENSIRAQAYGATDD